MPKHIKESPLFSGVRCDAIDRLSEQGRVTKQIGAPARFWAAKADIREMAACWLHPCVSRSLYDEKGERKPLIFYTRSPRVAEREG
jgi:hypothetical protein